MGAFFIERLQIEKWDSDLEQTLEKIKKKWEKVAFIEATNIALNDGDIYKIVSGIPNSGKSTYSILDAQKVTHYLREYFNIDVPPFSLKNDVIYTNELDVNSLASKDYQHKVVDDAYLQAFNLDNNAVIKYLIKVTNNTRNHHHIMNWNFQKPTRSVKGLFERFNLLAFKPNKHWAILMAMSPLMILTSDPWLLNQLISEKGQVSEWQIKNWLKFNPNLVVSYRTPKMKSASYAKYNEYKNKAQMEYVQASRFSDSIKIIDIKINEELYSLINSSVLTKRDAPEYLLKKYKWSQPQVTKFLNKYEDYERYRKVLEYRKGISPDLDNVDDTDIQS
jgi:hypothetical protein